MKKLYKSTITFLAILCSNLFISQAGYADDHGKKWMLDQDESLISFVSVKKDSIGEVHTFTDFSGEIKGHKATVTIKPDSVNSKVPIRNERMREFLFETGTYPTISITSDVTGVLDKIKKGKTSLIELPATLSLHGADKEVVLNVSLSRNSKGTMNVASAKPVIIKAADFNMDKGIAKLSELVGNIDITDAVPVSFVLTFKKG